MSRESAKVDLKARKKTEKLVSGDFLSFSVIDCSAPPSFGGGPASGGILEATGGRDQATWTVTLSHTKDARLLAMPEITLYQDAIATANTIPSGANVDAADYQMLIWIDWGETNNNNVKIKVFLRNKSAGTRTVIFIGAVRFIVEELGEINCITGVDWP